MRVRSPVLILLLIALAPARADASQQEQFRYWNSSWNFDDIDLADLSAKVAALGIDLPVAMRGRASVNLTVGVPWNAMRTAKAYRIVGNIRGTDVNIDTLRLRRLSANVKYADGVLTLPTLSLEQADGQINGTVRAELIPRGDFNGKFRAETFDIRAVTSLLAKFKVIPQNVAMRGSVGFDVQAAGKVDQISDFTKWNGSGTASVRSLQIARGQPALPPVSGTIDRVTMTNGSLAIEGLRLRADQESELWVRGNGRIPLSENGDFLVNLSANDFDYGSFVDIWWPGAEAAVRGKVDFAVRGTARFVAGLPKNFNLNARVASPNMSVLGLKLGLIEHEVRIDSGEVVVRRLGTSTLPRAGSAIESIRLNYTLDEQRLVGESLDAAVLGGRVSGRVEVARVPEGRHEADLSWSNISPKLETTLPFASRPTTLGGTSSGSFKWNSLAQDLRDPAKQRGRIALRLNDFSAKDQKLGDVTAEIVLADKSVSVTADGEILGGRLSVKTTSPLPDSTTWKELSRRIAIGMLHIDRASIQRVSRFYSPASQHLDGEISAAVRNDGSGPVQLAVGLRRVTASGKTLVDRALIRGTLTDGDLRLQQLTGTYAGGSLSGSGDWHQSGVRSIRIRLTGCDAGRMLLPISNASGDWLSGRASASLNITSSASDWRSRIRVTGSADLRDGALLGASVGDVHSTLIGQMTLDSLQWSVNFHKVSALFANGRGQGQLALKSGAARGFNLDSDWRLTHVNFRDVLADSIGRSTFGRADLTGAISLNGRNIRSANDLEGRFRFQLGGTDASAVPGIPTASNFLGATGLAGVRFTDGRAVGRISRGVARIEECVLTSPSLGFEADGTVNLASGRLALDAVLATGNFRGQTSILRQTFRPRVVDAIGIGAVNQILSDRTVVFEMRGNPRSPIVRLMPGETLRANAQSVAVRQLTGALTAGTILAP